MAKIRVYVSMWQLVGNRVTNPINIFADPDRIISGLSWISYHYAEANPSDGTPTNPFCLAFVKAEDFTEFDSLDGIVKLPTGNLAEELTNKQRNDIIKEVRDQFDIPRALLATAIKRKDIVVNLAKYIHGQFKSLGDNIKDEDFE